MHGTFDMYRDVFGAASLSGPEIDARLRSCACHLHLHFVNIDVEAVLSPLAMGSQITNYLNPSPKNSTSFLLLFLKKTSKTGPS